MTKTQKTLIFTGIGVIGVLIAIGVWKATRPDTEQPVGGFGAILNKVRRKHSALYEWFDTLPTEKQMFIEDYFIKNPNHLEFFHKELGKDKFSPELKALLKKIGYTGG